MRAAAGGVVVAVGICAAVVVATEPETLPPPPPPLLAATEQVSEEGVMTLVTVPPPEYESVIDDSDTLQTLLVTSLVMSELSLLKTGDETLNDEPEASVTEKLLVSTTIDWMVALEPDTFKV